MKESKNFENIQINRTHKSKISHVKFYCTLVLKISYDWRIMFKIWKKIKFLKLIAYTNARWCKALYSRVEHFRKNAIPQVEGHFRKFIRVSARNIKKEINLFIFIFEPVNSRGREKKTNSTPGKFQKKWNSASSRRFS